MSHLLDGRVLGRRSLMVVLDTCTWLWMSSEPKKLSRAARETTERHRKHDGLVVSIMSAWEIAKLVQKGKLAFTIPCREWIASAVTVEGVAMHPLTPEICVESTELPGSFHGDPADQLIVATARLLGAPLVTADRRIRDYAHVATLW